MAYIPIRRPDAASLKNTFDVFDVRYLTYRSLCVASNARRRATAESEIGVMPAYLHAGGEYQRIGNAFHLILVQH